MKNGKVFVCLLEECVDALNDGRFPTLKSTWHYVIKEENEKLITELLCLYQAKLNANSDDIKQEGIMEEFTQRTYGIEDPA